MTNIPMTAKLRDAWAAWSLKHRFISEMKEFQEDEDGAILPLVLFAFVLMVTVAGLGIDTMRHEMERTHLQATLDSAVLAGAGVSISSPSISNKKEHAQKIVKDYFEKSGMSEYLNEIDDGDVNVEFNSTTVKASADVNLDTYFMQFAGVDNLSAAGSASATKTIPKIEISMVLDTSGSMSINNRMPNLKAAAKEFTSNILSNATPGNASISVVPFSTNVTAEDNLIGQMPVFRYHDHSLCLEFSERDYDDTQLPTWERYNRQGHVALQAQHTALYNSAFNDMNELFLSCPASGPSNTILPYSMDVTDLHTKIDLMKAEGGTSGNIGIKWGVGLLDPEFRDISSRLSTAGVIDSRLQSIPADYSSEDTVKAVVMMSDGQNVRRLGFNHDDPKYLVGKSKLHRHDTESKEQGEFAYVQQKSDNSIQFHGIGFAYVCDTPFWLQWYECVYKTGNYYLETVSGEYYDIANDVNISAAEFAALSTTLPGHLGHEQLSWYDAWGMMPVQFYARKTLDWDAWFAYLRHDETAAVKDRRMDSICTMAKKQGTVIYTIGFEIGEGSTAEKSLRNCASSPAHYFRAEGLDINNAFSAIASNIQSLRLTQ